jgi:hypothetical protein
MNYCENDHCVEIAMCNKQYCEIHCGYIAINFDIAHTAWMKNKRRLKGSGYVYVCGANKNKGGTCQIKPVKGDHFDGRHCRGHQEKKI